ncbi:MAG: hypothetical protein ACPGLY_02455 [Rubripirellula sp.]
MMPVRPPADRPSHSLAGPFRYDINVVHWTVVFCRLSPAEVALIDPGTYPVKPKEMTFALDLPPLGVGSRFSPEMSDFGIWKV